MPFDSLPRNTLPEVIPLEKMLELALSRIPDPNRLAR